MSAWNHLLDGVKVGRIHSLPRGVTGRRCGFHQNSLITFWYWCRRADIRGAEPFRWESGSGLWKNGASEWFVTGWGQCCEL